MENLQGDFEEVDEDIAFRLDRNNPPTENENQAQNVQRTPDHDDDQESILSNHVDGTRPNTPVPANPSKEDIATTIREVLQQELSKNVMEEFKRLNVESQAQKDSYRHQLGPIADSFGSAEPGINQNQTNNNHNYFPQNPNTQGNPWENRDLSRPYYNEDRANRPSNFKKVNYHGPQNVYPRGTQSNRTFQNYDQRPSRYTSDTSNNSGYQRQSPSYYSEPSYPMQPRNSDNFRRERSPDMRRNEYRNNRGYDSQDTRGGFDRNLSNNSSNHEGRYNYPRDTNREDFGLKVRAFNPRETDWYSYKSYFETMAVQAGWSEKSKVIKLMGALTGNLTGITTGLKQPIEFYDLMSHLDAVHGLANSKEDALLKLSTCKKEFQESIPMFGEKVRQLVERSYPNYEKDAKNEQCLRVFLNGLPTKNGLKFHMMMKGFKNLPEAVEYGAKYDQISGNIGERYAESPKTYSRSNHYENESDDEQIHDFIGGIATRVVNQIVKTENNPNFKPKVSFDQNAKYNDGKSRSPSPFRKTPENSPCAYCKELGHWIKECPKLTDSMRNQNRDNKRFQSPNRNPSTLN